MEFIIKKKREGQSWSEQGSLYAANWQEAKRKFTDSVRNDLANDDQVGYYNDDCENKPEDYEGPGYYDISGGYWDLPLLDGESRSKYAEDVYAWTINKI